MRAHVRKLAPALAVVLPLLTPTVAPAVVATASAEIDFYQTGDPYIGMAYTFYGWHEGHVASFNLAEGVLPIYLNGGLRKGFWNSSECSAGGIVSMAFFFCSTSFRPVCPTAQGTWIAQSKLTTGAIFWAGSSGPVYANCSDGGGGGGGGGCLSATNTKWNTSVVDLTTGRRLRLGAGEPAEKRSAHLLTAELRVDQNGDKELILDHWAFVRPGNQIERASSPKASVDWLAAFPSVPRDRPLLVIQKPVHAVPMPEPLVRFDREAANAYMRSLRPAPRHATITARLEFAPDGTLLSKEVIRGNDQVGVRLADLVSVESLHGHSHRAIVFATFEVTRRQARLVGAQTALTKCCCNGAHCI